VTTGDEVDLGGRTLRFLHTPYLHWPDTQCTYLVDEGFLFSGDVFGCHFCDPRLFNDRVGDFRFSFEYYYAHIMRPFREYVLDAVALIEPLDAPPDRPGPRPDPAPPAARLRAPLPRTGHAAPVQRGAQREDAGRLLHLGLRQHAAHGRGARRRRRNHRGVRVSLYDLEGGESGIFTDLIEEADGLAFGSPTINADAVKPSLGCALVADHRQRQGQARRRLRLLRLERRGGTADRGPPARPQAARPGRGSAHQAGAGQPANWSNAGVSANNWPVT
jgi:hypothetical protein